MPMPRDGGRCMTYVRNPNTGRFDFTFDATENFAFDDTESETVLSLELEEQGGWVFDETGTRGSLLHTVKLDRGSTASELQGFSADALSIAIASGRIIPPAEGQELTSARRMSPGRYQITIRWKNKNGHETVTNLPYTG